jgi:hypothetical protein
MARTLNIVLISALVCIPTLLYGQKNTLNFRAGYGYYQGIHIGANYFYAENLNLGIGIGSHFGLPPLEDDDHYNLILENNLHFGNLTRFNKKPWIFGQQIMYWVQGSSSVRWKILSFSPTIGREFAVSKNIGLAFEVGPAFNLVVDVDRNPTDEITGWMWPVLYNGRVQLKYNF